MSKEPTTFVDGRIRGGHSLHDNVRTDTRCKDGLWPNEHVGTWRVVDCCEHAGHEKDIVECSVCGVQRTVSCNFDDEYS